MLHGRVHSRMLITREGHVRCTWITVHLISGIAGLAVGPTPGVVAAGEPVDVSPVDCRGVETESDPAGMTSPKPQEAALGHPGLFALDAEFSDELGLGAERPSQPDTAPDADTSALRLLSPGKSDFIFKHTDTAASFNSIWWSPVFKGGGGYIDPDLGPQTNYFGGYVRPLLPSPEFGELILGGLALDAYGGDAHELQGEYRFPFGLGFGGGCVEREASDNDIWFAKVTYRSTIGQWNYILEAQVQEFAGHVSPGGWAALYNEWLMTTFGYDGEHIRTAVGLIFPDHGKRLRPAFEVLYVDNSIGDFEGPRVVFANATMGYRGGFLSHPARLGRAMGPTGLEFGNPLGFLRPTWNRRLDLWELGQIADFRLEWKEFPNGDTFGRYEAAFFPFQLDEKANVLDYLFLGPFYLKDIDEDTAGLLGGFVSKTDPVQVSLAVDYRFDTNDVRLTVGLIVPF